MFFKHCPFQLSTEFKMFFKHCLFQLFNQEAHPCQQSNCPSQLLEPHKWHCAVEAWWVDHGIIKEIQIFNCPSLSFDIETNSMRKCLLKLFSLLQKKSSSHHHSNIQIAEERIDLSKYPPACLPEHGQQLKVNTSAFVYGGYWLSSTIDGNMTQFKTKNAIFFGNNESNTQDGENVARRIQRQFFKKQRWATVYCPQVFISGH